MIRQRLLAERPGMRIAILLQKERHAFYQEFKQEFEAKAAAITERNVRIQVKFATSTSPDELASLLRGCKGHFDAVAATGVDHPEVTAAVQDLRNAGIPTFSLLSDFAQGVRESYFGLNNLRVGRTAGCNVLVEKPIGLLLIEAERMVRPAREKRVFFAEALWTYFLPKFDVIQQLLDADVHGEIKSDHTEYGEHFTRDHRIFNPALAGGPLLDLGTDPVSFITDLLGVPERAVGVSQADPSGVHGQVAVVLSTRTGSLATMAATLDGLTPTNAAVVGTRATLRFGSEFNLPGPFELDSADGSRRLQYIDRPGRRSRGSATSRRRSLAASTRGGSRRSAVRSMPRLPRWRRST